MKTIVAVLFFSAALSAQAPAKPDPKAPAWPKPVPETQALRMDNLFLKSQLVQKDLENMDLQFKSIIAAVCKEAGLSQDECQVGKDASGNWAMSKNEKPQTSTVPKTAPETAKAAK